MYSLTRPMFFSLDPERAHEFVATLLGLAHRHEALRAMLGVDGREQLEVTALGRTFSSPVIVAAGFDKHAAMYNALYALGFGGVEVGTITAHAQPGNDRPRLFRLVEDRALINRMGFNNHGALRAREAILRHLPAAGLVLGINLGKSKVTPVEQAADDYAESARLLAPLAHYLVVNVSSPNTPGLRSLQAVDALEGIVRAVRAALDREGVSPPLLVKIAPDLADEDVDAIADLALREKLAGIIATNTTIARDELSLRTPRSAVAALGAGGLSGAPIRERSLAVLRRLYDRAGSRLTLVAAGGIETAEHAWQSVLSGATLVQVYTGFIYKGPSIARAITKGLREKLAASGFRTWSDAVGAATR
ncbi:MAG: quinone-dependent dihydroorotate dehydrogenase [Myxococcales bacterium]|nr:quinone-dependent dihydroorotate dehydrogenase [Myxococcales bacterium]